MSGFKANQRKADADWISNRPQPLGDIGTVEHLSILPLIDWYTERDDLVGEAGVSYLVQADDKRILFDVGANWKKEDPSPLLRNMRALGVERRLVGRDSHLASPLRPHGRAASPAQEDVRALPDGRRSQGHARLRASEPEPPDSQGGVHHQADGALSRRSDHGSHPPGSVAARPHPRAGAGRQREKARASWS